VYLPGSIAGRSFLACLGFLTAAAVFCSALIAADETVSLPASSPSPTLRLTGSFSMRYLYRTADTSVSRESDQDLFADLRLDLTRPRDNRYEFHFQGAVRTDLDGNQDVVGYSPLEDIGDTWGRPTHAQLLEANAVLNDPLRYTRRIIVGRQAGARDEQVFFDGALAEIGSDKLLLTLYGGAAVHFYEINWTWGKDTLEGAGLDYRPLPTLGMSADALAVKDVREFYPGSGEVHDRMLSFKVWQRFEPFTRVAVQYRYLNGASRDLTVRGVGAWQAQDAEMSVSYFRQFTPQAELSNELSLFYDVIGVSAPFQSVDVRLRKFIASRVAIDLGYFRRDLLDQADHGPFNKEYSRAFIDGEISDLFIANLAWTVTAERWKSDSTSSQTLGTDLTYRIKKGGRESRVAVGTYYSLYKYDYYADLGVRDEVRTYYLDGKYPLAKGLAMNGRYEYEHSNEQYQTFRLGMRYDF
jgi:hypothetical protein